LIKRLSARPALARRIMIAVIVTLTGRRLIMWNNPTNKELAKIPAFYSSEETPLKKKMIHMHFFIGGCDWYAAEYSPEEKCFFGFAILNNDLEMAEWGYFSLEELSSLKVSFVEVDRDLYWKPKKAIEIENIRKAQGWALEEAEVVSQNPKQEGGE
jgi:hypothetical protein